MYIIKKTKTESTIIYMEYDDPYYQINNGTSLGINNLYVYDKKYIPKENNLIPFEFIFSELTKNVFNYLYSADDDDDGSLPTKLIGEVDKARNILESEYKEFLKRQDYYEYVDKISFLKDEIQNKIEINKYKQNLNQLLTGRSR